MALPFLFWKLFKIDKRSRYLDQINRTIRTFHR